LIDYSFGSPGGTEKGVRTSLYLTGVMTLLSFLLFITLLATRIPFDATMLPGLRTEAIIGQDGSPTNAFMISLRNTGSTDLDLLLTVAGSQGQVRSSPANITLPRGQEALKVPLVVTINGLGPGAGRIQPLTVTFRDDRSGITLVKKVSFIIPEMK
ncbi:MAG: FixG Ig-like domain-containing protein, partial [Nitrospirota bacterium]